MKICASCGASLPDGAAFCISCGSKEFTNPVMPDLNAPEEEKPKIEYDQYGRPIGQQYQQPEYEQPHFAVGFEDPYKQRYSDSIDHPQFLEGYQQQGYGSQQSSYGSSQYIEGYQPQYQQPAYDEQYQQPAYDEQYDGQYDEQYDEQYEQGYEQPVYDESQYAQPAPQPQYSQPAPQPQYSQPAPQPQYSQPAPQPQYSQPAPQPQYSQPAPQPQYAQPAPQPVTEPEPEKKEIDPYEVAREQKEKGIDPHEAAKNFKFEKKETDESAEQSVPENPKNLKEYIAFFRNTNDHTNEYDPYKFAENKKYCQLAVIGFTFWIPLVFAKESASARFYANQGLLIFITELILLIPELLLTGIVSIGFSLGIQIIIGLVINLIITLIVYSVPLFMIVSAFKNIKEGKIKDIPFIGRFRIIK